MKIAYLGTAAYEGVPALFCECDACRAARKTLGRNVRCRASTVIDDELLIDLAPGRQRKLGQGGCYALAHDACPVHTFPQRSFRF